VPVVIGNKNNANRVKKQMNAQKELVV